MRFKIFALFCVFVSQKCLGWVGKKFFYTLHFCLGNTNDQKIAPVGEEFPFKDGRTNDLGKVSPFLSYPCENILL
jgi:hypothetical protein